MDSLREQLQRPPACDVRGRATVQVKNVPGALLASYHWDNNVYTLSFPLEYLPCQWWHATFTNILLTPLGWITHLETSLRLVEALNIKYRSSNEFILDCVTMTTLFPPFPYQFQTSRDTTIRHRYMVNILRSFTKCFAILLCGQARFWRKNLWFEWTRTGFYLIYYSHEYINK